MSLRIPLLLVNLNKSVKVSKRLTSIVSFLVTPFLKVSLKKARLKIKPINYLNAIAFNSILYFIIFSLLFSVLFYSQSNQLIQSIILGLSIGFLFFVLFFVILYMYPNILANKIGDIIDSELLYALNDMLVQVKAKVELYQALVNVVEGDYDYVSDELQMVVDDVESGKSMHSALKKLALGTKSNFMKRMAWQLMNSIKSGSDSIRVIESLISELKIHYHTIIGNYIKELNVLTLIYLTLAVVAPTIGITILIILSSFGGLSINKNSITIIVSLLLLIQPVLIGFINSRRPSVNL